MDVLRQKDDLETEQAATDDHKGKSGNLGDLIQQLVLQEEPVQKEPTDPKLRSLHRHLVIIEVELRDVSNTVKAMAPGPDLDRCLLKQHEEQIRGLKIDLTDVSHNIIILNEDDYVLAGKRSTVSKAIFNTHLQSW